MRRRARSAVSARSAGMVVHVQDGRLYRFASIVQAEQEDGVLLLAAGVLDEPAQQAVHGRFACAQRAVIARCAAAGERPTARACGRRATVSERAPRTRAAAWTSGCLDEVRVVVANVAARVSGPVRCNVEIDRARSGSVRGAFIWPSVRSSRCVR